VAMVVVVRCSRRWSLTKSTVVWLGNCGFVQDNDVVVEWLKRLSNASRHMFDVRCIIS